MVNKSNTGSDWHMKTGKQPDSNSVLKAHSHSLLLASLAIFSLVSLLACSPAGFLILWSKMFFWRTKIKESGLGKSAKINWKKTYSYKPAGKLARRVWKHYGLCTGLLNRPTRWPCALVTRQKKVPGRIIYRLNIRTFRQPVHTEPASRTEI